MFSSFSNARSKELFASLRIDVIRVIDKERNLPMRNKVVIFCALEDAIRMAPIQLIVGADDAVA
jgi:hypothetical protein